ncbi:MAG TPA: alpha/beta hydrolase [Actinomycetota bacterium]|nr:alpha/beta hydrolase [Actinomycetota bacterium]
MRRAAAAALCLILLSCGPEPSGAPSGDTVSFTAADGVELVGDLRGGGETAVVLLHMYPSDRTAWFPFAEALAAEGHTVLTFDFRGYGDSEGERQVGEIWRDALAAVRFMRRRGHERVVLVGASMGGTAALITAAREPLAGLVTLSAPSTFMGLTIPPEAVELIEEPKLFVAAEGDAPAAAAAQQLYALAPAPKEVEVVEGSEHGIGLVGSGEVRLLVLRFVRDL